MLQAEPQVHIDIRSVVPKRLFNIYITAYCVHLRFLRLLDNIW